MRNISFKEMVEMELNDILNGFADGGKTYYWKNGDEQYREIVDLDLLRGRFYTDDGDFSEFEWEIAESRIYVEDN